MCGLKSVLLVAYLAVVFLEESSAVGDKENKEGSSPEKTIPVIKTYMGNFRIKINELIKWENIICDGEKQSAKVTVIVGARQDQTTTYYLAKEGAHGLRVTFYGRSGSTSQRGKRCTFMHGTEKHPVKIDELFIDLSKYKFQSNIKMNEVDTEVWTNNSKGSTWYIHREGEKLTLLEEFVHGKPLTEVSYFDTTPMEGDPFKYPGKLEDCDEED